MLAPGLHFPKGWPSSPCPPPALPCPPSGDTDFHLPTFSAPTRLPFVFLFPPYFPPPTLLSCSTARPLSAEAVASRMRTPSSSAERRGAGFAWFCVDSSVCTAHLPDRVLRAGGKTSRERQKASLAPELCRERRLLLEDLRGCYQSPHPPTSPGTSSHSLGWDTQSWAPSRLPEDLILSSLSLPPSQSGPRDIRGQGPGPRGCLGRADQACRRARRSSPHPLSLQVLPRSGVMGSGAVFRI